jgi:uncharacterized membrane protein YedE/YeeE
MSQPLPWFIAGPLIGLIVPALLLLREKQFGISSSYRFVGAVLLPKISYFNYNKDQDRWQFQFAIGLILSGLAATQLFGVTSEVNKILPQFDYEETAKTIYDSGNILQFFLGGVLVGFGSRYANGCTAGHCIMGVSQFALSSILATVAFFIGGLLGSHFINPLIF